MKIIRLILKTSFWILLYVLIDHTTLAQKGNFKPLIPIPFVDAINNALDTSGIVAVGESHGIKEMENEYLNLLDDNEFIQKVDDIIIEFGNSLYQPILDRFIFGEKIPRDSLRLVWLNHTNSLLQSGNNNSLENFLIKVRLINRSLPKEKKIRVLAGDPPVDWNAINHASQFWPFLGFRDLHYASVVWRLVIDKHRKCLMIMGKAHFKRVDPSPLNYISLISILEKRIAHEIPIIHLYKNNLDELNQDIPCVALVKGSILGSQKLENKHPEILYEDQVDAILYLGKGKDLTTAETTDFKEVWLNELDRRSMIIHGKTYQIPLYDKLKHMINNVGIKGSENWYLGLIKSDSKRYDITEFYLNYLGYEYLEKEMYDEAIFVFNLAVLTYPDSANVYDSLGEAFFKIGNLHLAKANFEKSLLLNPNNENAQKMIEDIKKNK